MYKTSDTCVLNRFISHFWPKIVKQNGRGNAVKMKKIKNKIKK